MSDFQEYYGVSSLDSGYHSSGAASGFESDKRINQYLIGPSGKTSLRKSKKSKKKLTFNEGLSEVLLKDTANSNVELIQTARAENFAEVPLFDEVLELTPLEQKWADYLARLPLLLKEGEKICDNIRSIRERLHTYFEMEMEPPQAGESENGGITLEWDNGRFHLSVEVQSDENIYWFFKDREDDFYDGEDSLISNEFPPASIREILNKWKEIA